MRRAAFFPPGLHPVLDGGEGDEDAMVAPEVPAGGLTGQVVLHHQPDSQRHDPIGVVGLGRGQVRHVGSEVAVTPGAIMLGVGEPDLTGPALRAKWNGRTLGERFETIRSTMPLGNAQSLGDQTYLDIVAFILQSNEIPAGNQELVAETAKVIVFAQKP